jgi:O-antigen ligase
MKKKLFVVMLIAIVLFPEIKIPVFPDIRVEDLILLVFIIGFFKDYFSSVGFLYNRNEVNKFFLFFALSIAISIVYAAFFKDYYPIARDFFEFIKVFKYFTIFILVASFRFSQDDLKFYFLLIQIIFAINAVFAIMQFFNVFDINSLAYLYTDTQIHNLIHNKRVIGTVGNSNYLGASMMLPLVLSFSRLLNANEKRYIFILLIFLYTVAIVMTNSRTALILYIGVLAFVLILNYNKKDNLLKYIIKSAGILFCALALIGILLYVMPEKLSNRIFSLIPEISENKVEETFSISIKDNSFNKRKSLWNSAINKWQRSILFGWGPGKRTMRRFVDGEWFLLLRRYGLLGTILFLVWMIKFFRDMRRFRQYNYIYTKLFALSMQVVIVAYLVFMIPSQLFHSIQLMSLLMFFMGLVYSQNEQRTELRYEGINFVTPLSK